MSNEEKRVREILKEHHAVLARSNKHAVWKLPTGQDVVLPSTPSDFRAWKNAFAFLNTVLNLNEPDRGAEGERRERRTTLFTRPMPPTPLEAPKLACMSSGMLPVAQQAKAIKHPAHGTGTPVKEIAVDVSGLLTRFRRSR